MQKHHLSYVVAVIFVVCVLIVFWPSGDPRVRYTSETTYHVTQDQMVPIEKARIEAARILEEAWLLSKKGELTPDQMFTLQKRMERLSVYAEQNGPNPRSGAYFYSQIPMMHLVNVRDNDKNFRSLTEKKRYYYRQLFETDPEWLALNSFQASTTVDNKGAVIWYRIQRYLLTIPLGIFACILLMMWDGVPLGYALVKAFNHPFLMALYPIGLLWVLAASFESGFQHHKEVKRLVSGISYATAACISIFSGGTASAQTVKKDEKKKSAGYSLQLDSRVIAPIEGPPSSVFNRATFNAEKWLAESISTVTPETGVWYNETGIGVKIVRTPPTTVSAIGIISDDAKGIRKIMFGVQYFRAGPTVMIAVPVARVEKTIGGPIAIAAATNPFFRLGREGTRSRLALSPDVFIRKTFGKPLAWTAGLGFDLFTRKDKGDRAEIALLKNSFKQWQIRGRYIHNFTF